VPIFISYSHSDKDFVDKLAAQLVIAKAHVWVDRWELRVGDSIVDRVQAAIQGASALLVILSKSSVSSEWCKKELNVGLVRELEEKRVVVLPVLLDDCDIPLFLRDKLYADFRTDFDEGLKRILEAVAKVTSDTRGRIERPEGHTNWAIDRFYDEGLFVLRLTFVEQAENISYCVLTLIRIVANKKATQRYEQFVERGLEWFGRRMILEALASLSEKDFFLMLEDETPKSERLEFRDLHSDLGYDFYITSRLIGEDTGRNVLVNIGNQIKGVVEDVRQILRESSKEELEEIIRIVTSSPHV
jgi:hypothetical protein